MFRAQPVFSAGLKDFGVVLLTGFNVFMKCNSAGVCVFFLSWVEEKLPLMWRFHNPPSVIYQGINTHTEWQQTKKKVQSLLFSVSQCFFFLLQSQGRVYGGEWCVNVGYQTRIKGLNNAGLVCFFSDLSGVLLLLRPILRQLRRQAAVQRRRRRLPQAQQ